LKDVTEHMGVKYSLQPHGLRSKLLYVFALFVVAFGGALALASPAQADPTDPPGQCYVAVVVTPTPSPPASPSTTPSPTTCPVPVTTTTTVTAPPVTMTVTAPPVTTKITVTVTKQQIVTIDQTQTQTQTVTITPSESPSSTASVPQRTPDPTLSPVSHDAGSLVGWGLTTVGVIGAILVTIGLIGVVRGRQARNIGRHHVDNSATTMIPVVRRNEDDYNVDDYGHGDYDPALGGRAGETMRMPAVESDASGDADTKPQSPVQ